MNIPCVTEPKVDAAPHCSFRLRVELTVIKGQARPRQVSQAYSLALFKALSSRDLLTEALSSTERFLDIVRSSAISTAHESTDIQPRLV
jgi:hypothetical protein